MKHKLYNFKEKGQDDSDISNKHLFQSLDDDGWRADCHEAAAVVWTFSRS